MTLSYSLLQQNGSFAGAISFCSAFKRGRAMKLSLGPASSVSLINPKTLAQEHPF
jgi:hypothetical protein